jgi:Yqey-like protein.
VEASLKIKLAEDLKQALRDGDKVKLGTVRMLVSASKNAESVKKAKLVAAAAKKAGITDLNELKISGRDRRRQTGRA